MAYPFVLRLKIEYVTIVIKFSLEFGNFDFFRVNKIDLDKIALIYFAYANFSGCVKKGIKTDDKTPLYLLSVCNIWAIAIFYFGFKND